MKNQKYEKTSKLTESKKFDNTAGADTCICCGEIIPEGRMICINCEGGIVPQNYSISDELITNKALTCDKIANDCLQSKENEQACDTYMKEEDNDD